MFNELWKPVPGYKAHLEASNLGNVRTLPRKVTRKVNGKPFKQSFAGKVLSTCRDSKGYVEVGTRIGGKKRKFRVHRLVAMTWVKGYKSNLTVDHIDGNKANNHPSNLEWVTREENSKRQWRNGLGVTTKGEKKKNHKLKDVDTIDIWLRLRAGEVGAALAREYGVSRNLISHIKVGRKPLPDGFVDTLPKALAA